MALDTDGKITITISDDRGKTPEKPESSEDEKKESKLATYAKHELMHLVKDTVRQGVDFSIQQIGALSGDYALQRQVSNVRGLISRGKSIGLATLAGAKIGGVWGAAIGAGVAVASGIFGGLERIHNTSLDIYKQNYEIEQIRARTGMNSSYDGNRGTEY